MSAPTTPQTAETATPETQESTGRDAKGRFTLGNPGGPGNPYARQTAHIRRVMLSLVQAEHIAIFYNAVLKKMAEGNVSAMRLYAEYMMGKALKGLEPDRMDAHEWEVQKETAAMY